MSEEKAVYVVATQGDTLLAGIQDRLAKLSQAGTIIDWSPSDGETIAGVIIGGRDVVGAYGRGKQLVLQTSGGKVAVWLTSWLSENFKAQGAAKGDLCAITYNGKRVSGFGKTFNCYSVVVEKADG